MTFQTVSTHAATKCEDDILALDIATDSSQEILLEISDDKIFDELNICVKKISGNI